MLRLHAGESCLAAFLPAPTFAVWCFEFLNPKPAGRKATTPPRGAWRTT